MYSTLVSISVLFYSLYHFLNAGGRRHITTQDCSPDLHIGSVNKSTSESPQIRTSLSLESQDSTSPNLIVLSKSRMIKKLLETTFATTSQLTIGTNVWNIYLSKQTDTWLIRKCVCTNGLTNNSQTKIQNI